MLLLGFTLFKALSLSYERNQVVKYDVAKAKGRERVMTKKVTKG